MPAGAGKAQAGQTLAQWLRGKGMTEAELAGVVSALPGVFELEFAFGSWSFGEETLKRLKVDPAKAKAVISATVPHAHSRSASCRTRQHPMSAPSTPSTLVTTGPVSKDLWVKRRWNPTVTPCPVRR